MNLAQLTLCRAVLPYISGRRYQGSAGSEFTWVWQASAKKSNCKEELLCTCSSHIYFFAIGRRSGEPKLILFQVVAIVYSLKNTCRLNIYVVITLGIAVSHIILLTISTIIYHQP